MESNDGLAQTTDHFASVWSDNIFPANSKLVDAAEKVVAIRRPFLLNPMLLVTTRDQRLSAAAWLHLGSLFAKFWGFKFEATLSPSKLPKEVELALLRPRMHILEERFSKLQARELANIEASQARLRYPPSDWQSGYVNRLACWLNMTPSKQLEMHTDSLVEAMSLDLGRAERDSVTALQSFFEADMQRMLTARISYLAMNPRDPKRSASALNDKTPKKKACKARLSQLLMSAREELFDEACLDLPDLLDQPHSGAGPEYE